jgi:hypothetical protein
MATCAQAIREVFKTKEQVLATKQIIDAVRKKYPNQWKEVTIRTHTMGCSVNHSSSKYYPSFPRAASTMGFKLYSTYHLAFERTLARYLKD